MSEPNAIDRIRLERPPHGYPVARQRFDDALAAVDALYQAMPGMLEIAALAMPDSYFQTDSRVKAATEALARVEGQA